MTRVLGSSAGEGAILVKALPVLSFSFALNKVLFPKGQHWTFTTYGRELGMKRPEPTLTDPQLSGAAEQHFTLDESLRNRK